MSSLVLVGHNKCFSYAAFGALGSTHDAQMLKSTNLFKNILHDQIIPDSTIYLRKSGEVPLATVGDSAFPQFHCLIKCYKKNAQDLQQQFNNKKLCSACVVTENAYGMLKGRWHIWAIINDATTHHHLPPPTNTQNQLPPTTHQEIPITTHHQPKNTHHHPSSPKKFPPTHTNTQKYPLPSKKTHHHLKSSKINPLPFNTTQNKPTTNHNLPPSPKIYPPPLTSS